MTLCYVILLLLIFLFIKKCFHDKNLESDKLLYCPILKNLQVKNYSNNRIMQYQNRRYSLNSNFFNLSVNFLIFLLKLGRVPGFLALFLCKVLQKTNIQDLIFKSSLIIILHIYYYYCQYYYFRIINLKYYFSYNILNLHKLKICLDFRCNKDFHQNINCFLHSTATCFALLYLNFEYFILIYQSFLNFP